MATNGTSRTTDLKVQTVDEIQRSYGSVVDPKIVEDIPVELGDGKRHSLRMDFRAMKVIQQNTGLVMWNPEAWDAVNLTPDRIVTIIWACLLHEDEHAKCTTFRRDGECTEHEHLTIEDVESLPGMQLSNFTYITDRIGMLWGAAMPKPDADSDPNLQGTTTHSTG